MGNKRIKTYWLALLLVLMSVNLVLSIEPTQAHYLNTAVWNTVVEAEENVVTSKFFSKVSDAPITVLVGDMTMEAYPVKFNLDCSRDVTGSLTWSVDQQAYVEVYMTIDEMSLVPNSEIQLEMGEHDVTMWLIPTAKALKEVHGALDINVSVNWADSLQGKFRVTLPAVTEADLVVEPTEPESSNPGTDDPSTGTGDSSTGTGDSSTGTGDSSTGTGDSSTGTGDSSTGTGDSSTGTDDSSTSTDDSSTGMDTPTTTPNDVTTDSDALSTGKVEIASYVHEKPVQMNIRKNGANVVLVQRQTRGVPSNQLVLQLDNPRFYLNQPGLTAMKTATLTATKPIELSTDSTEPTTAIRTSVTEPVATEPAPTEPAEPTAGEEEEAQFRLETIDGFDIGEKIPVKLYLTEDITRAYLGIGQTSDTETTVHPFPEYTCYSLDNGESYFMLYTDKVNTIELIPGGSKEMTVLLDLSRLELFDKKELTLAANGYDGTTLVKSTSTKTVLNEDTLFQIDRQFLTKESSVTIALNENWKNYTFDYKVQMLTGETAVNPEEATDAPEVTETSEVAEETAMPEYVDEDASSWSSLAIDEENYKITFQIKDVLPQAGTYRVLMNWSKDEICFAETQATFFINYLLQPEPTEPEATEPEATEPEATEPEATEPEVTEPEPTEPETTEPEPTEPETTEPESNEEKVLSSE